MTGMTTTLMGVERRSGGAVRYDAIFKTRTDVAWRAPAVAPLSPGGADTLAAACAVAAGRCCDLLAQLLERLGDVVVVVDRLL